MLIKRKYISLITSTIMATSILNFSTFIPVNADSDVVFTSNRIYGTDRFETAAKIADKGWTTSSEYAVIATGEDYPDALCAAPLANKYNAPIILTKKNKLIDSALKELTRLSVKTVFIIGGTGTVSADVESQIKDLGIKPIRIAGINRYKTSFEVAKYLDKSPKEIAVATGDNFADALSFSSIAAMNREPILLTEKDSIDSDVQQYISDASSTITTSYVIGGTGVVSDSVLNSLKNPIRLSGKNRYETNTAVLKYFQKDLDLSNVYLATGNDFPDALTSSVLASNLKAPILLADSNVDASTISFVNDNTKSIKSITAIGGTGVISDDLLKNTSENFVNYIIPFSDTNLQNAIDKALIKKDGEPILKRDVDNLKNLDLRGKCIADIDGLQFLTNLHSLDLSYNHITRLTDLTPLSNLTNLNELYLSNMDSFITKNMDFYTFLHESVNDLTPLNNLTNLTVLDLSHNNIENLTPLSNLTNLTKLNLSDNDITDLTPLTNLTNLTNLNLTKQDFFFDEVIDIEPLINLTNLTNLSLSNDDLTDSSDLYSLSNLINLTYLDLSFNCISDLQPLSYLTHITKLNLSHNNITDLTPIANLTNLTNLDLSTNSITELTPLSNLLNITKLNLSINNVTDLKPLTNLTNLAALNLSLNNPALDTNALKTALPNCDIAN